MDLSSEFGRGTPMEPCFSTHACFGDEGRRMSRAISRKELLMKAKAGPDLRVIPMLANESLYVGVDIGKFQHIAGFVSTTLLTRFQRFEGCPALVFEQSREGFCALVDRIRAYVPLQQVYVLYVIYNLERSGRLVNNL